MKLSLLTCCFGVSQELKKHHCLYLWPFPFRLADVSDPWIEDRCAVAFPNRWKHSLTSTKAKQPHGISVACFAQPLWLSFVFFILLIILTALAGRITRRVSGLFYFIIFFYNSCTCGTSGALPESLLTFYVPLAVAMETAACLAASLWREGRVLRALRNWPTSSVIMAGS